MSDKENEVVWDEFEEVVELVEINSIVDIIPWEEEKDVDISTFFSVSELQVSNDFEKNTIDVLENNKTKTINLKPKPRVRLFKLKKPIFDIIKNKKNKTFSIWEKKQKIKIPWALDLQDFEKYNKKQKQLTFDFIIKNEENFLDKLNKKIFNSKKQDITKIEDDIFDVKEDEINLETNQENNILENPFLINHEKSVVSSQEINSTQNILENQMPLFLEKEDNSTLKKTQKINMALDFKTKHNWWKFALDKSFTFPTIESLQTWFTRKKINKKWISKSINNFLKSYYSAKRKQNKTLFKTKKVSKNIFQKLHFRIKNMRKRHKIPLVLAGFIFLLAFSILTLFNSLQSSLKDVIYIKNMYDTWKLDFQKLSNYTLETNKNLIISDFLLTPVYLVDNKYVDTLKNTVKWWKYLFSFAWDILKIYKSFEYIKESKWIENIMFSQFLNNIDWDLDFEEMWYKLKKSIYYFNQITFFPSDDLKEIFNKNIPKLSIVSNLWEEFLKDKDIILDILWDNKKKTYAIMFQNQDEIRPMWGFMWSAAIIELYKWKVEKFEKKDIYALEWGMKPFTEIAPEWINKLTPTLWLRDSNYYISAKESSKEIKRFLEKINYEIDWVIFINQNILLDFLEKYWEVDFTNIWREISSENFSLVTSTLVETKLSKTDTLSTPKQILFDFMNVYFKKLKEIWDYPGYFSLIKKSIEKKDIIFYLFDNENNELLKEFWIYQDFDINWFSDFNYPYFTSISWNKSDRYIQRTYQKTTQNIWTTCNFKTKFAIKQKHNFNIWEEILIKDLLNSVWHINNVDLNNTLQIQWKGENKQFVRVILPKYAQIEKRPDFNVVEFLTYKEVNFYITTQVWGESWFSFEYTLENPTCQKYSYVLFKQPWITKYDLNFVHNLEWINKQLNVDFIYK